MARITLTTFLISTLTQSVVLEANLWLTLTRPSHCPPSHRHTLSHTLFLCPSHVAGYSKQSPCLGTFCLHLPYLLISHFDRENVTFQRCIFITAEKIPWDVESKVNILMGLPDIVVRLILIFPTHRIVPYMLQSIE